MKLYHGSTYIVKKLNLDRLNYKTDFGRGFYTTTDLEQAKRWAKLKAQRLVKKGEQDIHQYINIYEFSENLNLSVLKFNDANKDWLEFILKNRMSDSLLHSYDNVYGPVANDNLYRVLVSYEDGLYDIDETIKRLKAYKLSNQISFHTEESLKCLKYIETMEVFDD